MNSKIKNRLFILAPWVLVVALLAAYLSQGVEYFQKRLENQTPDPRITLQQKVLQKPAPDIEKLQSQLEGVKTGISAAWASIPGPGQGMDIYNRLLDLDRQSAAKIMRIDAGPAVMAVSGNVRVAILPYSLEVHGRLKDVMDFISLLNTGDALFQGLKITSINIEKERASNEEITLDLELEVLTLPPSTAAIPAKTYLSGSIK
jgi:hypothetical protein